MRARPPAARLNMLFDFYSHFVDVNKMVDIFSMTIHWLFYKQKIVPELPESTDRERYWIICQLYGTALYAGRTGVWRSHPAWIADWIFPPRYQCEVDPLEVVQ